MSNSNDHSAGKNNQNHYGYENAEGAESKFWRKVKQDPVVPIGLLQILYYN
jgi:hypothetical protein